MTNKYATIILIISLFVAFELFFAYCARKRILKIHKELGGPISHSESVFEIGSLWHFFARMKIQVLLHIIFASNESVNLELGKVYHDFERASFQDTYT